MKSWTIVAYTYQAEVVMPEAIVGMLTVNPGDTNHGYRAMEDNVEAHLNLLARIAGVDRTDESTFDSDEFPKVVFVDQIEDDETVRLAGGEYARYGDVS